MLTILLATALSQAAPALDAGRMADQSRAVIRGTVRSMELIDASAPILHTRYLIDVEENLEGISESPVDVRMPGGHLGDRTQQAVGVPVWEVGSEVVVFLPRDRRQATTAGLSVDDGRLIEGEMFAGFPTTITELEEALASGRSR